MSNQSEETENSDEFMNEIAAIKKKRFDSRIDAFVDKLLEKRVVHKNQQGAKEHIALQAILLNMLKDGNGRTA